MNKLIGILIGLNLFFFGFSQNSPIHFVELNYSGTFYNSINGKEKPLNSGFGIVVNRLLTNSLSFELGYYNAWTKETILTSDYKLIANWFSLRFGLGMLREKFSLRLLLGVSIGNVGISPDFGWRFTKLINKHIGINVSMNFTPYRLNSFSQSNGIYDEPLSSPIFLSTHLGLSWNFSSN